MFSDPDFRTMLLLCHTEEEFKIVLEEHTRAMIERMSHTDEKIPSFDSDNVSYMNFWLSEVATMAELLEAVTSKAKSKKMQDSGNITNHI